MLWKSNVRGKNLCTGQKVEPDIESPIINMDNKYLMLRRIKDFDERFISLRHIAQLRFNSIDDIKVKLVEYESIGYSLETYGGRKNICLYIQLINGEEINVSLGDYYIQIDDINRLQSDIKNFMSQPFYK